MYKNTVHLPVSERLDKNNLIYWNDDMVAETFLHMPVSDYIENFFSSMNDKAKKVLDCGCGGGRYTDYLNDLGFSVFAIDYSPKMVETTRKRMKNRLAPNRIVCAKTDRLPFDSKFFDIILSNGVLHNVTDPAVYKKSFIEIKRVLCPGGFLYLSTFISNDLDTRTIKCVNREKCLYQTNNGLGMTLLSKDALYILIRELGFEIYMTYDPLLKTMDVGRRTVFRTVLRKGLNDDE